MSHSTVYNESALHHALARLPKPGPAQFGYLVSLRLRPVYGMFVAEEHWGSPEVLDEALRQIAISLDGYPIRPSGLADQEAKVLAACPHMDDWDSVYTTFAIYSSACVAYTVRFLCSEKLENAVFAARNQYEAACEYVGLIESPDTDDDDLDDHPVVQREMQIQQRFLELSSVPLPQALRQAEVEGLVGPASPARLIWK